MSAPSGDPEDRVEAPGPAQHWLEPVAAAAVWAVPLVVGALRAAGSSQWRDDVALLRASLPSAAGVDGVVSAVLGQLALLLPVGGRVLRASLPSVLCLALGSFLAYRLTRRLLRRSGAPAGLDVLVAASAALTMALGPGWQGEGTVAGGATVAAALCLAALLALPPVTAPAEPWAGVGLVAGLAVLENRWSALPIAVAALGHWAQARRAPAGRAIAAALGAGLAAMAVGLLPVLLRELPRGGWGRLAALVYRADAAGGAISAPFSGRLGWLAEQSPLVLILAAAGLVAALPVQRRRVPAVVLAGWALLGLLPGSERTLLSAAAPSRLLELAALAALAGLSALGLAELFQRLGGLRLPGLPVVRALLVAAFAALAPWAAELSAQRADRRGQTEADRWTAETLAALPPGAVVFAESPAVLLRLEAARSVEAARPDLLVVPRGVADHPTVAAELLRAEPALRELIQELTVQGTAGELALSTTAAARPLFVEVTLGTEPRLREHLVPAEAWARFMPHALGPSDRREALRAEARRRLEVWSAPGAVVADRRDPVTDALEVRTRALHAAALVDLGELDNARRVLRLGQVLTPTEPRFRVLEERLVTGRPRRGTEWLCAADAPPLDGLDCPEPTRVP